MKKITPEMIIAQWKTPVQIEKGWNITEAVVRKACINGRLTDEEKFRIGDKLWLISIDGADRLWKRRGAT